MTDRRVTKGRIKVFSSTVEPGLRGLASRAATLIRRPPVEIAGVAARALYRRGGRFRSLPFPQAVHIEITNRCNLACVMCPHPHMEREKGLMSEDLFRRVIDELSRHRLMLENVAIMGLGEPLLHPDFERFLAIAAQKRIPNLYASTNAMPLTEKRAERIVADGALGRLIVSFDGATKETYEKIRVGADYEHVVRNVRRLLEIKKQARRIKPLVTIQILWMPQTSGEIDAFCDLWLPHLGDGDELLIKEVDTFGGLVQDMRIDAGRRPAERIACRQLWKDMSISWDGRVTVCCKDVFYLLKVGDAGDSTLAEIWKSARWNALRRLHENGGWGSVKPCDECEEWYV